MTDETGQRYATWEYNENGQAKLSAHGAAKNIDLVEVDYLTNGYRNVTTKRTSSISASQNILSTYITQPSAGSPSITEVTGHNPIRFERDAMTGYLEYSEDKGLRTEYSNYDNKGNPGTIKEAVNTTEQREANYTYDSRYHSKIATMTEDISKHRSAKNHD